YRSQFSSLNNCHHLISNSLGAMPDKARDAAIAYADTWAERGVRSWEEDWWELPGQVSSQIGMLLNAAPDSVSTHANVTSAQAVLLSCFEATGKRNKIVMIDMEFPSIKYIYHEWVKKNGAQLQMIGCPDGIRVPTEQLLDAIDETTLLVPISHVLFRSSYIIEAEAIIKKAHEVGAMVVLDVYQSLGTVPVDLKALNVDFAVGGCLKWLCGGPGTCFLYVRPDHHETLEPSFTGWMAHENPFAFASEPIEWTDGSYRFMNGTPSVPALYMCQPGLEIVTEITVDTIRKRSTEMTTMLLTMANERNWRTTTPADPKSRAGTVAIDLDNGYAIATELNKRDFLVDYRPKAGIRMSPHFYTTDQEIVETIEEVEKIIAELG
ncbi:MAG: aminotransferase class V-fold PLP-dependent enzyme, partial [candidate division Zixibacteria bacterium]